MCSNLHKKRLIYQNVKNHHIRKKCPITDVREGKMENNSGFSISYDIHNNDVTECEDWAHHVK